MSFFKFPGLRQPLSFGQQRKNRAGQDSADFCRNLPMTRNALLPRASFPAARKKEEIFIEARKIIGNILILSAVAFTAYLAIVMARRIHAVVLKSAYTEIFLYELLACAFFLLFALDVRFGFFTLPKSPVLKGIGWFLRVLVVLVTAVFLFFIGKITLGSLIKSDGPAKNALVLGLALENGKPTEDLIARLDTAEKYLESNPDAALILTGGNPDENGKTEAAAMREILLARGVAEEKLRLEDQAETTVDNFKNTMRMVNARDPIALITSNYHMDRAVHEAKKAGFEKVLRSPAPSSFPLFGANVMWEMVLELNGLIFGR